MLPLEAGNSPGRAATCPWEAKVGLSEAVRGCQAPQRIAKPLENRDLTNEPTKHGKFRPTNMGISSWHS